MQQHHRRHRLACMVTATTVGLTVAAVASPLAAEATQPTTVRAGAAGPTQPSVQSLTVPADAAARTSAVPKTAAPASRLAARLAPTSRRTFAMVGLSWDRGAGAGVKAQVRVRSHGTWSAWQTLEVDEQGTDPTSRPGTEPLWVGSADAVTARVSTADGHRPVGLRIATVDPGRTTTAETTAVASARSAASAAATTATSATAADGSPAYTARPTIVTRAQWGAPAGTGCDTPRTGTQLSGVVVHHTAGSNTYSAAQAPAVVRAIAAYHMQVRGWCDIGYNFLVDKYGVIYEGRAGGMNVPVRGAHAGNWDVNLTTTGVSMIGNYDVVVPSAALKTAMVKLVGWRLGTDYLPATTTISLAGRRLPIISGHRDVYAAGIRPATSTACPGRYAYAWLSAPGGLRARVAAYTAHYTTKIKTRRALLGTSVTGPVYAGEYPTAGGYKTIFTRATGFWKKGYGTSFLSGPILARFNALGAETGTMGFPVTNIKPVPSVPSITYVTFDAGRIYARAGIAYSVYGAIYSTYHALGSVTGRLGYPTSSIYATTRGLTAKFAHGYLTWVRATNTVEVHYA